MGSDCFGDWFLLWELMSVLVMVVHHHECAGSHRIVHFLIFYLFFGCVGSLLLHAQQQISLVAASWGLFSSCGVWASHCAVFSCFGHRL